MSAWPEAMYVIDKINESFKLVETFKDQINFINNSTDDINTLKERTDAHNTKVQELITDFNELEPKIQEAINYWSAYSDSELTNLGNDVQAIETLVKSQERQIAFVARKDENSSGPVDVTNASAYSVWFIQE